MNNKITKAIIPAAGIGSRFLPASKSICKEMFPILDVPTIQLIVEDAVNSGITDIIFVLSKSKNAIADHFDYNYELEEHLKKKNKIDILNKVKNVANLATFTFVRQKEPLGLGHAILQCKHLIQKNEKFVVLLGDNFIKTTDDNYATKQCIDASYETDSTIIGVQEVSDPDVEKFGIVKPLDKDLIINEKPFILETVVEKPKLTEAPSNYAILGIYVFNYNIFNEIENVKIDKNDEIQLTDAILSLALKEKVYAKNFIGKHYDIGSKLGFVKATIDIALENDEIKEDVLDYIKKINSK